MEDFIKTTPITSTDELIELDLEAQQSPLNASLSSVVSQPPVGFIELYLLDFNLPSKYIAMVSSKSEKVDEKTYRIETIINGYLARKIENIRRMAYLQVGRYFANTSIGWIAVNEKGIQVVNKLNDMVIDALKEIVEKRQIKIRRETYEIPEDLIKRIQAMMSKYYVKPIRIMLKYDDAKFIIENVINQLKEGLEELREKVEKAKKEEKKALAKVYEYNSKYQEMLLQSFEEFYAKKFQPPATDLEERKTLPP